MIASGPERRLLGPVVAALIFALTAMPRSAVAQTAQTTAPLPTLQLGPPPDAKPPERPQGQTPAKRQGQGRPEQQLQLRADPDTGRPLTARELQQRESQTQIEPRPPAAQKLQPRRLIVPRAQATPAQAPSPAQSSAPRAEPEADIVIEQLARPDLNSIGVLDAGQGGLGVDMWAGSERLLAVRLLPTLPTKSRSAAVRGLSRRLLLSAAASPQGQGDSGALLHARIEKLFAAGWLQDTGALLQVVPPAADNPSLDAIRLDLLLITGHRREACTLARNLLENAPTAHLKKIAAFCLAAEGRTAEVDLYEQVLYADGIEDPPFYRLLGQLAGREPVEEFELPTPSPLHLAMLLATDQAPSEVALQEGSAHAIWALAMAPRAEPRLRAEAAEIAAERGIISLDVLRTIYRELPLTAEQESDPVTYAASETGALAAASFYRAIADSQNVEASLNLIEEAWRHASARGRTDIVSAAIAPEVAAIQPLEELSVYANITMRVLLRAGEMDAALTWFEAMIRPARQSDPHAAAAVLEVAPLIYAADVNNRVPAPAQALSIWWREQNASDSSPAPHDRGFLLALLEVLQRPVPDSLWLDSLNTTVTQMGAVPTSAVLRQLQLAAAASRRAETALLVLAILGDDGPQGTADAVLVQLVDALMQAGLIEDAHILALESLLKRGF